MKKDLLIEQRSSQLNELTNYQEAYNTTLKNVKTICIC
jgi:hypothetical protein